MERMHRTLLMVGGMMVLAGCYSSYPFTVGVDATSIRSSSAAVAVYFSTAAHDDHWVPLAPMKPARLAPESS